MDFTEFREAMVKHFNQMTRNATHLFEVDIDKEQLWNTYLDSFPEGTNLIFRERREFDCSCCRQFIKSIGHVVAIKNCKVETLWDFQVNDKKYQTVLDALSIFVKNHTVSNVYIAKGEQIGTKNNLQDLGNGKITTWSHFYLQLPKKFIGNERASIAEQKGEFRDTRNVFKRSLDEITEDSIQTVLELIHSNTLYKGQEWKAALTQFLKNKKEYCSLSKKEKENYTWEQSAKCGHVIGRIRNLSIGTLLVDLSEGIELDEAVRRYEKVTAPANYKRPKPIFTKRMLEDAKKTIEELGFLDSLYRRFATLDDITVNNILFSNKDAAKRIFGADDIFAEMEKNAVVSPKKFSRIEEISASKFVKEVLPFAQEVEVYLENRHAANFVSLIAPQNNNSKTMFKWNNNFSWAYSGNVTDSIKANVKAAGGRVDGVLRFSIQWNDLDEWDRDDLDAHCIEPSGEEIYFSHARKPNYSKTGGQLDIDIINPIDGIPAVENITWSDKSRMLPGVYRFFVNQYTNRGGRTGFRAEIEFDGKVHFFCFDGEIRTGQNVEVAEVILSKNGTFSIKPKLSNKMPTRELWGLHTNQFIPVSVICYSPNFWDEQAGIGHRHYFFMLKDCKNPELPNGFYNEFLKPELEKHKRVLEALGSKMRVQETEDQLSGLGFSETKRNELVVKVIGNTERTMKVKF